MIYLRLDTEIFMAATYTISKKKSALHLAALASNAIRNQQIIPVGGTHVLIPAKAAVDFGHLVSHAKNRVSTRRMSNQQVVHVAVGGVNTAIRMSHHDLRTYQKVTGAAAVVAE